MNYYIYKGDTYCSHCGESIVKKLSPKVVDGCLGNLSIDDSEPYPQGPFSDCNEADYAVHCGDCGVFLENALTPEGRRELENDIEALNDDIERIAEDKELSDDNRAWYQEEHRKRHAALAPLAEHYNVSMDNPKPWVAYCVSVYLIDRAYGGHEEGGWWYDYGNPVLEQGLPLPFFTNDKKIARAKRNEMQVELDKGVNVGRRDIGSVLSEGVYRACIDEGYPKSYPEQIPHYE